MDTEMRETRKYEIAIAILEALGIPKEKNVAWFELKVSWRNGLLMTIKYEYYPEPFETDDNGNIVSILKKCKLVEIEEDNDK